VTQMWTTAGPAEWERRSRPLVTVVPYALLAALAAFTAAVKHDAPGSLVIDLGLCAAVAIWILLMFTLQRRRPGVFLTGLILLTLVLVVRDPWFGFYAPALYFYAFRIIGWPRELYFVSGCAVVAGTAQAADWDAGSWTGWLVYLAVVAANVVPMCGLAWFGTIGERYFIAREAALREAREANERLAGAMAENAALQERLVEQARSAGVLDERQRMAREIHDTIAQGLAGIVVQLQAAARAEAEPAAWRHHHGLATELARESLTEARRAVQALRPEALTRARLADALDSTVERWGAVRNIPVEFSTNGVERKLPADLEMALLRVAQEALANVGKHAQASRVGVTLSFLDTAVALDVRDDGKGFEVHDGHSGFGLTTMSQRVEALGGTVEIESEPGNGTAVSALVPVREDGLCEDPPHGRG
jgi:signal transduction histidine kinase